MSDARVAQRFMWDAIHDADSLARPEAATHFLGDDRLDAHGRLRIYAEMYEARLESALRHGYPWTAALLGETMWAHTVRDYVRAHPPSSYTLAQVGALLPGFLQACDVRPDAPAVATLECLRGLVVSAEEVPTQSVQALAAHGDALASMRCDFAPTMRHARVAFDVCAVVDALVAENPPPQPAPQEGLLVAWRQHEHVFHTMLMGAAAEAFGLATAGEDIATVCNAFADAPDPARAAFASIGAWFQDGWVAQLVALTS